MRTPNHVKIALASAFLFTVTLVLFWLTPSSGVQAGLSTQGRVEPISQPGPMITPTPPTPCLKPAKPKLYSPTNGGSIGWGAGKAKAFLQWYDAEHAKKYGVIVRKNSTSGKTVVAVAGLTTIEYETKSLRAGPTYFWRVRAKNSCGKTPSDWWSFKVQ